MTTKTSSHKRFVWVLDIHDFLLYLEDCLYRISPRFPWLLENAPIDLNYPWTETDRFYKGKTQRDHLIDWIVRYILKEFYCFHSKDFELNPEFRAIYDILEDEYDLHANTKFNVTFPFITTRHCEVTTHSVLRQSCWLYIEASYDPTQQPR